MEKTQGSTSLGWLDSAPPEVRDAVLAASRRPGALVIEESEGEYDEERSLGLLGVQLEDRPTAQQLLRAKRRCKWTETKANYRPGAITWYWFKLRTSFCFDGSNILAPPSQDVSEDGSWGWAYEGTSATVVEGWPAPETYRSYARGTMNQGQGLDWVRRPWIEHIVHGSGKVEKSHHD